MNEMNVSNYRASASLTLIIALLLLTASCSEKEKGKDFPFLNTELAIEERVNDLVERMTLEEKISQMVNDAPAIERLGIPKYNWWSEGLHGVARAGLATVFPQAIGLGATWDESLLHEVSTAIADEARAKHSNFIKKDKRFIYQGLTLWSPNINIFRDPRWGRGQETYGEDPYLTGKLAVQFIKGLQGDDTTYYKTIATAKHFAVHSGPEEGRHSFNSVAEENDLRETYLPQFEMAIKEGKPYSVMCAYNRYNGEACCGSERLLQDVLRNEWGFTGYIVSDCDAIVDIYKFHQLVQTPEEAAALAVKSGTDLECGNVYLHLKEAVNKKLITEAEIDVAVKRLFVARFKLGMFDPPEKVNYAQIPYSVVDSKEHQALALDAARKSIVLLKNKGNILPLKKDIGTLAVIGPNADQWLMLLGNYNGVPSDPVTPLRGIQEKLGTKSKVLFSQGCELADGMPMFYTIPGEYLFNGDHPGINVSYYNNKEFGGEPLFSSIDKNLDANWYDKAPREDMDDDSFSVRWSGELKPDRSGYYQLGIISTCNTKLFLNDSLVAKTTYAFRDEFGDPRLRKSNTVKLDAGKRYKIEVQAIESFADAQVQLVWATPKPELKKQALAIARQADVVVLCMGITPRMEGEEMDVKIDGFNGGDRTRLDLPELQQQLIKEIQALGKPVILVLLNGSALAINWEDKNVNAIIEAWYPGQAAGQAIADVLFGDYNPGGKLPVTFYKSVNDLPAFDEYKVSSQTYRYFKGEPLYPFGFGLSYTTFAYENLKLDSEIKMGDSARISVTVKNTGKVAGDEVAQVYLSNQDKSLSRAIHSLKGFKRIHLTPGESSTLHFTLSPNDFSIFLDGEKKILPGKFEIFVGGGQPQYNTHQSLKSTIVIQ
ncbi:MAG: glycoside hydrolase family 3 C-terminal domain-containing protein [Cyclobacteriaceae bacterium]|nr:glycoside hydrolase family 3 C-terminal domain-containing protein [Cyclobacteriaceae bacterium]